MKIGNVTTNPGEMRTKIELLKREDVADAGGFTTQVETSLATVWARWQSLFGDEVWAAAAQGVKVGATVRIRYRTDVDATMRIRKDNQVYEIVSHPEDIQERHEYLEFKVSRLEAG